MAGNTQPVDTTSAGTTLNPPVYKTLPTNPYATQITNNQTASFLVSNVYTTGSSTATNSNASLRSFDFIQQQLTGSISQ